jgi:hypothetical protein
MLVQVRKHLSKMAGVDVLEWEESVTALHVSAPCFPALSSSASVSRTLSLPLSLSLSSGHHGRVPNVCASLKFDGSCQPQQRVAVWLASPPTSDPAGTYTTWFSLPFLHIRTPYVCVSLRVCVCVLGIWGRKGR